MDILGKLFGSESRVKIMRLFLSNPEEAYDVEDISHRSKVNKNISKKEIDLLLRAGLIKKKSYFKLVEKKKRGKVVQKRVKKNGYALRREFPYLASFSSSQSFYSLS